MSMQM